VSAAREWSDWLSPVVVKNMRQDTRATSFGLALMGAQCALGILALSVVLGHTGGASPLLSGLAVCFWIALIAWLLLAIPQRSLTSLRREEGDSAFELVAITRLSAWRLVLGTWTSLMLQAGFGAVSLLPYVLLRYFFGGVELFAELVYLLALVLISGLLTAGGLFSSTLAWGWLRRLFSAGLLLLGFGLATVYAADILEVPETLVSLEVLLAVLAIALPTAWLLIVTAGRMAPLAENHALRKRLFGACSIVLLGTLMHFVAMDEEVIGGIAGLLLVVLCADAAYERAEPCPVHYLPFVRFGIASRALGSPLMPGWAGGVIFTLLCVPAVIGALGLLAGWPLARTLAHTATIAAFVLLPLALSLGRVSAWGTALVVHPLMLLIGLLVTAVQTGVFDVDEAGGVVPLIELFAIPDADGPRLFDAMWAQGAICAVALGALAIRLPVAMRARTEAEQQAIAAHAAARVRAQAGAGAAAAVP
jgi:hypothetical protein